MHQRALAGSVRCPLAENARSTPDDVFCAPASAKSVGKPTVSASTRRSRRCHEGAPSSGGLPSSRTPPEGGDVDFDVPSFGGWSVQSIRKRKDCLARAQVDKCFACRPRYKIVTTLDWP
jgi:hypothetical protein